jgi:quinol monooxygenase YgiN
MIVMNLVVSPVPNRTAELIEALRLHMGRTQVCPGCIECHISRDAEEKNVVHYQEAWNSWRELEKHIRSHRFSCILELMEQSSNTPNLSFNDVQEIRGMEYVRNLRKQTPT